jgi:ribose transport system permease protein
VLAACGNGDPSQRSASCAIGGAARCQAAKPVIAVSMMQTDRPPAAHAERHPAADPSRFRLLHVQLAVLRAGPALILALLIVIVSLTTPVFFTTRNFGNLLSQTAVIAILALGQLVVIVSRGIDLSVGSTVALSGVVGAIVFRHEHSTVLVILAVLGTGLAVGLANGLVLVFGRIPHPFIVTLASLSIVRGIAYEVSNGSVISGEPSFVNTLGGGSVGWLPYAAFVVIGAALLVWILMTRIVWGRWLYAIGGNPEAARRAGIPIGRVLISVYAISGLAAGIGGLLTAGLLDAGSSNAGMNYELNSIAAVIIGGAAFAGGRGGVMNALVGAFTLGVIEIALNLNNVNAFIQLIVIGIVVLIAVECDVLRRYIEDRLRSARGRRHA